MTGLHPRAALFDAAEPALPALPVCDHYCGVEARMRKSLELQVELGPVFDVTLDAEDGAPVGGEVEHAYLIAAMLASAGNRHGRVGVRVLPIDHPRFADVMQIVLQAAKAPAYLMLPKPRGMADIERAAAAIDAAGGTAVPLHALVETHGALREVQAIAAHPRIESLSFGLMDFVSAHRGAIPASAMSVRGQFEHPLVVRAKLEIAAGFGRRLGADPARRCSSRSRQLSLLVAAAGSCATHRHGLAEARRWVLLHRRWRAVLVSLRPSRDASPAAAVTGGKPAARRKSAEPQWRSR